jgi:hypothetical protein
MFVAVDVPLTLRPVGDALTLTCETTTHFLSATRSQRTEWIVILGRAAATRDVITATSISH